MTSRHPLLPTTGFFPDDLRPARITRHGRDLGIRHGRARVTRLPRPRRNNTQRIHNGLGARPAPGTDPLTRHTPATRGFPTPRHSTRTPGNTDVPGLAHRGGAVLVAGLVLALARQHGIPTTTRTALTGGVGGNSRWDGSSAGERPQPRPTIAAATAGLTAGVGLAAGVVRVGVAAVAGLTARVVRIGVAAVAGLTARVVRIGVAAVAGLAARVVRIGVAAVAGLTATAAGLTAAAAGLAAGAAELTARVVRVRVRVLVAAVTAISILIARDMLVGFLFQHQPAQTRPRLLPRDLSHPRSRTRGKRRRIE
ncbi:hypothetical protein AB0H93_43560, partial [Saccharopolyspora sp. NPDC050642]